MPKSRGGLPSRSGTRPFSLARAVAEAAPETLHQWIDERGVTACGEIVAAMSPAQLSAVFDLQLWRAPRPGAPEELDPSRFGDWVELFVETGEAFAADRLAALDPALTIAMLAHHVAVFDPAVLRTGGDDVEPADDRPRAEIGGYVVFSRGSEAWDAIVAALASMADTRTEAFHRIMRGCRRLSNSTPEPDGFHELLLEPAQAAFELAVEREQRRGTRGYVAPEQARALLQAARTLSLHEPAPPPLHPIAREALVAASGADATDVVDQLAFLANVLVAAATLQGRAFTPAEAAPAVAATCRLGVENWPASWAHEPPPGELPGLVRQQDIRTAADPLTSFAVGWRVLYAEVCLYTARRLADMLGPLAAGHAEWRPELMRLRQVLVRECEAGTPWRAHAALDVLQMLDLPAWAALVALTGEYPVLLANVAADEHSPLTSVSVTSLEMISTNAQISAVHRFVGRLPATLHGAR